MHGDKYWMLIARKDGQILYNTSAAGTFQTLGRGKICIPWQFTTKEAAEECWRKWSNAHPAYAAECLHEVWEAEE